MRQLFIFKFSVTVFSILKFLMLVCSLFLLSVFFFCLHGQYKMLTHLWNWQRQVPERVKGDRAMATFSKLELTLQLTHKNICMEKMATTGVDGRMISVISMSQGRTSQGLCGLLSQKPNIHSMKAEFTNCCFCMLCIVRQSEHLPSAKKKTNKKPPFPSPRIHCLPCKQFLATANQWKKEGHTNYMTAVPSVVGIPVFLCFVPITER